MTPRQRDLVPTLVVVAAGLAVVGTILLLMALTAPMPHR